ncbi:Acyl-CoA dehydrogenase [Mycena indigotica]|uniref:Acyl-CoA dehydrogenase n=1 Tax=Mycena indigotica TaxID=2126181 RepID=A0A8H6T3B5_9AGAR|nr:Acyl-CoA dehydrogenase [Mycena indigotica]KAF7310095.1 Acyl-CoA dehydrogenase [Mycena indigotica]
MAATKQFTKEEVALHNKQGDLWIVIDGRVFDVSRFAAMHPGGLSVLLDAEVAGQDATDAFFGLHRHEVLLRPQYARLQIGTIVGESERISPRAAGALSSVPYAEPTWLTPGYHSPYFTNKHRAFQTAVRQFCEEHVLPDALAREEDGKPPSKEVWEKMAEANILAMRLGPGPHLKGRKLLGGIIQPEELTIVHSLILIQEFSRLNARGYADGLGNGAQIGLPPILHHATPALRDKIAGEYFAGKKFVSLAISEAFAGSDVSRLKTFATKTDKGWLVTGTKKWITGGMAATYFTVGCRSAKGMVVLVIERGPGVETKPIKTSYSASAGTAFVTFENVLVPFENQLGEDGNGLHVMLANFNSERWGMTAATISSHRTIVEECLKWATQRKVFGKPLVSQAVIRSKLAAMISRVESAQAWIENITFQMMNMSHQQQSMLLAGQIALLKSFATRTAQETAKDAIQIFGGRGITLTGMGKYVERFHHTAIFDAILGGTEDVLDDLGVRQAIKVMPKGARL